MDKYYSDPPIELWKKILGDDMHYHFGITVNGIKNIDEIGNNCIRDFYKYIKPNSTILDIGCGWGGTMKLLKNELNCNVSGITISKQQYDYCKDKYNVTYGDVEQFTISKTYDYILLIEVATHFKDIEQVLKNIRRNTNNLIISFNGYKKDKYIKIEGFQNMILHNEEAIREILHNCGWKILYFRPIMEHSKDSFIIWKQNLENNIEYKQYLHTIELYQLCNSALSDWNKFLSEWEIFNIYCVKV